MQAPFVAATVVRAQSPTSVRAGDSAIVRPDGAIEGFVGGTCAEASVRLYSLRAMESGEPVLLRILPGAAEGQPEAEEGSVTVKNPCLSGGALEVFLEPHLPAPTMRVVGSAPIAVALADLAGRVGYAVESGQADLARPAPDDAAVVVASHGHDEERVLTEALRAGVPYVALVASEVRGRAVRESLDLSEEERAGLHTPAGLEIGAETPEEIALAILAEIVALRPEGEAGRVPRAPATAIEATPTESPSRFEPSRRRSASRPRRPSTRSAGWRSRSARRAFSSSGMESSTTSAPRAAETPSAPRAFRMARRTELFVTGLVLAAGGSRRLGEPKQLLPYGSGTLLDHALDTARASGFDQLIVAIGGSSGEVRSRVDLSEAQVVENPDFGEGCSSSIAAGLSALDPRAELLVLMLGDQPGVTPATVRALIAGCGDGTVLAACLYDDGRGHPLAFGRGAFDDLRELHGDKAVWKLMEHRSDEVVEIKVSGPIPRDVDTRADYEAVLTESGSSA